MKIHLKTILMLSLFFVQTYTHAIAGGNLATSENSLIYQITVQVQAHFDDGVTKYCSGVIIDHNKVLTAVHCLLKDNNQRASNTVVHFSSQFAGFDNPVIKVHTPGDSIFMKGNTYQENNDKIFYADLAILDLRDDIKPPYFSIKLATRIDESQPIYTTGYGGVYRTYGKGMGSLAIVNIQDVRPNDVLYIKSNKPTFIETPSSVLPFKPHICDGDDGGPVFQYINNQTVLIGINSTYYSTDGSKPVCSYTENENPELKYIATNVTFVNDYLYVQQYLSNPQPYPGINSPITNKATKHVENLPPNDDLFGN